MIAATGNAIAFVELGAVALGLSFLARGATRVGLSPIPLYLIAGLVVGKGGVAPLDVSADFLSLTGQIGVLLLLLTLGLEYSGDKLRAGARSGALVGVTDLLVCGGPGVAVGLALGWEAKTALLLGGATWVSSSGVAAKVLRDLGKLNASETPAVLTVLVIEDLAIAVYLPVVAGIVASQSHVSTLGSIAVALVALAVFFTAALRWGRRLSALLSPASDESLLLAVVGVTLLVGGLAEQLNVSAAIGAFLVGLALSDAVQARVAHLIAPLRDLFAATFFLFFSFGIDPKELPGAALPALVLVALTVPGKFLVGWLATRDADVTSRGRTFAGAALVARGEFSIVIAALGASLADGDDLATLAAGYVLLTTIIGPVMARMRR